MRLKKKKTLKFKAFLLISVWSHLFQERELEQIPPWLCTTMVLLQASSSCFIKSLS